MGKKEGKPSDFTIGIVDSHIQTAISISEFLENKGFHSFEAFNANKARAKCETENPDLLLVATVLDGEDGYDLAKTLKKYKILFLASSKIEKSKSEGLKNIIGQIHKPVNNEELLKKIKKALKI